MPDLPQSDLLDNTICMNWLTCYFHPDGLSCPHCGSVNKRLFRQQKHFPAYRCQECDGYYTLQTGTLFEKTRQSPLTLVLLLYGVMRAESTAQLAHELNLSRKQVSTLRQRLKTHPTKQHQLTNNGQDL